MNRAAQRRIEKGQRSKDSRRQGKKPKRDWYDTAVLVVYLLTLLTTAAATGFMGYQSNLMRQSIIQVERSIVAAEKQVGTSIAANNIVRQHFTRTQRAWIAPFNVIVSGNFANGGKANLAVEYKNVGHEPATNMRFITGIAVADEIAKFDWPDYCSMAKVKGDVLPNAFPSEQIGYTTNTIVVPKNGAELIVSGSKRLYLNGCITYTTMAAQHFSRFCFYWISSPQDPMNVWTWRYCAKDNESD